MAIGALGAAALDLPMSVMRGLYVIIGIIFANAVLSGHTPDEIPLFAYVGIIFAFNLIVLASAGIVAKSLEKLPYGWTMTTWRAGMSWLVAIAVMGVTLMVVGVG